MASKKGLGSGVSGLGPRDVGTGAASAPSTSGEAEGSETRDAGVGFPPLRSGGGSVSGANTGGGGVPGGRCSVAAAQTRAEGTGVASAPSTSGEAEGSKDTGAPPSRIDSEPAEGSAKHLPPTSEGVKQSDDIMAWLLAHGYELIKSDDLAKREPTPAAKPTQTFENPPEDLMEPFEFQGPPDGYDRILVQVTKSDLEQGVNKAAMLQMEGWVVEKRFFDGAMLRLKRPKAAVEADRKRRLAEYKGWLQPRKIAAPANEDGKVVGTPIAEAVETSPEVFTTDEILNMSRTGHVPSAAEG
jgi:hypothetical protein